MNGINFNSLEDELVLGGDTLPASVFEPLVTEPELSSDITNNAECPHCKFIESLSDSDANLDNYTYWLLTEVFVYLHGGVDYCNFKKNYVNIYSKTENKVILGNGSNDNHMSGIIRYPNWCCQKCGDNIGYMGRYLFMGLFHKCKA